MNDEKILLPTGDYLRQLIGQTNVKAGELRSIIRNRGIFTGSDAKDVVGPIIIKTGLSPYEYTELRESYRTKEESPKSKTRSIKWGSENTLLESLPDVIDYDLLLNDQFGVCQLLNPPCFVAEGSNPDHIYMEFEIQRNDLINNWGKNTTVHKGRVEFKKSDDNMEVSLSLTHTAKETKDFGNKVADSMVKYFKDEGHIDKNEKMKTIKFSDFDNEGRVQFMNELTQKASHSILDFIDTKDIHFSPDNLVSNPPDDLAWMKDKIEDLKLKGKGLHSTFFVNDGKYHKYIQLFGVSCDYQFISNGYSGTCRILFEFSDKDDAIKGSELTLNISLIRLELNDIGISKTKAKKNILDSMEKFKMELYDRYKLTK